MLFREKGWPQGHAFGLMVARFQLSTVGVVSVLCVTARLSIGRDLGDYAMLIAPTGFKKGWPQVDAFALNVASLWWLKITFYGFRKEQIRFDKTDFLGFHCFVVCIRYFVLIEYFIDVKPVLLKIVCL